MNRRRPCIAVAVVPRLFGDALSRVLATDDRDILVLLVEDGGLDPSLLERQVDVAVVSGPEGDHLRADAVVRLPAEPSKGGVGSVTTRDGVEPFPFVGITDLIELVERLCAATAQPPQTPLTGEPCG